jgi:hypothetical protein
VQSERRAALAIDRGYVLAETAPLMTTRLADRPVTDRRVSVEPAGPDDLDELVPA